MERKRACSGIQMSDVLKEHNLCNIVKIFSVNNNPSVKIFLSHISSAQILIKVFRLFDSD